MSEKYYKAINFDLDTHNLKLYYPGNDYHQAYFDIRNFFKTHHFLHRQGSGYISDIKINSADVYILIDELIFNLPWIKNCVRKIDITNIGSQYDLTELLMQSNAFSNLLTSTTSVSDIS